jgi:site-specific recombinase XerD
MARIREFLIEEKSRHGKLRYLFHRRPDGRRMTIKGQPGEPAFEARYSFLEQGGDLEVELKRAATERWQNHEAPQNVSELVRYHADFMDALVQHDELSSYTYEHYLRFTKRFAEQYGEVLIHSIEDHHIEQILDNWSKTKNAWNNALRAIKHLFKYGKQKWGIKPDPAHLIDKKPVTTDGHLPWSEDQVKKFFDVHRIGSRPHLTMMLLLHASPRRADLVKLGPKNLSIVDGQEVISFTPQKTERSSGVVVTIPLHPDLKAAIDATPTGDQTFLITERGKPYSADGFSNHVLDWRKAAGIVEPVSAHGMRKTVGINMAENAATPHELMAALGHTNTKSTAIYTKDANRAKLSMQAVSKATLSNITKQETEQEINDV